MLKTIVNPDEEWVRDFRKELKANGMYCPCRLEKNKDTKCMCKDFREQETEGFCHCGMYQKVIIEDSNDTK